MKKVVFLALSVSSEILDTHFAKSFWNLTMSLSDVFPRFEWKGVVFTQGFDYEKVISNCKFIRDDSVYNKGLSISEVREYFTQKVIEEESPDYIVSCDDDFKFGVNTLKAVSSEFEFMESSQEVGLVNFHYKKGGPPDDDLSYRYDFNPSRVATRSGIMFRTSAYRGWGGQSQVRYFEECVLATLIYKEGYRVLHSLSDTIHKTKPTGLGLSQEKKYGKNNIPNSGRKVLCDEGLLIPSLGKLPDGQKYLRYDVPLRVSRLTEECHQINLQKLLCTGTNSEI